MDPLNLIISALIDKGGIWGVIASLLFFWNIHKENNISKKEKTIDENNKQATDLLRSQQESFDRKEKHLRFKIDELEKQVIFLQEENKKLLRDNSEIEESRVEDLKDLLSQYHSTATNTLQALEKFEFFIRGTRS
jgi:polyhydroxyalkanoate synthesis regulator phasin